MFLLQLLGTLYFSFAQAENSAVAVGAACPALPASPHPPYEQVVIFITGMGQVPLP